MPAPRLIQAIVAGVTVVTTGTGVAPFMGYPQRSDVLLNTPADTSQYMPLRAGSRLTYETIAGYRFHLTYGPAVQITWFDGTRREVVPVVDSRCECRVLMHRADGEVRAVGAVIDGQTHQWGEYIVVAPASLAGGRADPVETPAGVFEQAVRVNMEEGPVWFAPGVGIVKTRQYLLVDQEG